MAEIFNNRLDIQLFLRPQRTAKGLWVGTIACMNQTGHAGTASGGTATFNWQDSAGLLENYWLEVDHVGLWSGSDFGDTSVELRQMRRDGGAVQRRFTVARAVGAGGYALDAQDLVALKGAIIEGEREATAGTVASVVANNINGATYYTQFVARAFDRLALRR